MLRKLFTNQKKRRAPYFRFTNRKPALLEMLPFNGMTLVSFLARLGFLLEMVSRLTFFSSSVKALDVDVRWTDTVLQEFECNEEWFVLVVLQIGLLETASELLKLSGPTSVTRLLSVNL